jgi:hypothetical protein
MYKLKNIALSLIALIVLSVTANATTDSTRIEGKSESFTVKYLGNDGDYLVFEVVMQSADAKHTSLQISDKAEGNIYTSAIRSSYRAQRMKIEKKGGQELDFKLMVGGNVYTQSFVFMAPVALETK